MRFERSPDALVELFERVVPDADGVTRRKMFGYPAAFVTGNLFVSLFGEGFVLRLGPAESEQLLAAGGRPFEPMDGRPMRGYVVVPADLLSNEPDLRSWVGKALAFGRSLPPK
jgi:TfoX/Sxy family transcriptional regulator of competence genes